METGPRTQQIGSRCFLLALFSVACLAATGCGHNPSKDKNGKLPDDAVRNFIELVKADDYEAARKLWYGESKQIAGFGQFEVFCARYKQMDPNNCKISRAKKGKAGFSMVRIDWEENGTEKHVFFGLKIIDGEWKMKRGYMW